MGKNKQKELGKGTIYDIYVDGDMVDTVASRREMKSTVKAYKEETDQTVVVVTYERVGQEVM